MPLENCPRCGGLFFGVCASCFGSVAGQEIAKVLKPNQRAGRTNQYGGKGIIKYNPSIAETQAGIRQDITVVDWQSIDGNARALTIEVGRIETGGGGTYPASRMANVPVWTASTPYTDIGNFVQNPIGGNRYVLTQAGVSAPAGGPLGVGSGIADGTCVWDFFGADVLYNYPARVQVILGTPGSMLDRFYIDIARGQRFTVAASYVAATVSMLPPGQGLASGSMAAYGLLGYGTAPTLAPIIYTVQPTGDRRLFKLGSQEPSSYRRRQRCFRPCCRRTSRPVPHGSTSTTASISASGLGRSTSVP